MAPGNTNVLAALDGLVDTAVRAHGPGFLERGGPMNRARNEQRRGATVEQAAKTAAKQAKGHIAELHLSAAHSARSGLFGRPFATRPNPVANDPHVDLEVLDRGGRVGDAQVGVGSPSYLRSKAQRSKASQVVINRETREHFRVANDQAFALTDDRLRHEGIATPPLSGKKAKQDATEILSSVLEGELEVSRTFRLKTSLLAGGHAFVHSFGRSLLFGAVDCLYNERDFDESMINDAIRHGADSLLKTGLQTHLLTGDFLERAGHMFDAKLIHSMGTRVVWAGAFAEVVVETAKLVVAWARNELTFEKLLGQFGVVALSAAGAATAGLAALQLTRGMHPAVTIVATLLATWGGGKLGQRAGEALFLV